MSKLETPDSPNFGRTVNTSFAIKQLQILKSRLSDKITDDIHEAEVREIDNLISEISGSDVPAAGEGKTDEWISVKDRLAPRHQTVIALNADGRVFDARVCYGMHAPFWTYPSGHKDASDTCPSWINVTHWMPLPNPPQP